MKLSNSEKQRLKVKYGPWAVVTGASSGIGLELATQLADAGFNLVLCARGEAELQKIAQAFSLQYGIETRVLAADLSVSEGVERLIAATQTLPVGLLVAAAGYGIITTSATVTCITCRMYM